MSVRYLLLLFLVISLSVLRSSSQSNTTPLRAGHIHIRVQDVDRTKAFYRDKLGLKMNSERAGEMVQFDGGKLWFGKWRGTGTFTPGPIAIGIEADSVQAAYNMLKQRGVTISNPPTKESFGWSFTFRDPDGYEVEVEGENQ